VAFLYRMDSTDYRSNSIGDSGVEQQIKALPTAGGSRGAGAYLHV
jgi:hypothetical protein